MKPVRLPITSKAEDKDAAGVGLSPRIFSSMFSGGRQRRPSLSGDSLGCLSLLDAGEQLERPRAVPSPGLAGEILPSCSLKVIAQPTIHVHRPRAVLSSPENDELQGQVIEKVILKAPDKTVPTAPLTSAEDKDPSALSKEVPKAVISPPDEFLYVGDVETSVSDVASSSSTSSNLEHTSRVIPNCEQSIELAQNKESRMPTSEAPKGKQFSAALPPKSRHEQSGNEENVVNGTAANRTVKKHSYLPSSASRTTPKRHSTLPVSTAKGNSGRVLRPWY